MTDFKTKMAELAAKYNISHQRDIDWHNFVYEVQRLKEGELNNVHDLKILPEYFQAVKSGDKTFEVRFNDRNFQKGDVLHLREWDGNGYTGESIYVEVTYILDSPDFCKEGYVIMAIKQKEQKEEDEHLLSAIQVQFASHAKVENGKRYAKLTWDEFKKIAFELCGCGKQKPAEWSDEDEKKITFLERLIRYNVPEGQYGWTDGHKGGFITKLEAIAMLKSLRPQPKQEWSEIELEFRGEKVKVKRPCFRDDKGRGYSTTEQDEDVAWYALRAWCEKKGVSLYDLYPRTEWSEEDEKMLEGTLMWLDDLEKQGEYVEKERSWLKSLRPQPKEEQSDYITTNKEFFQLIYDRLVNVHKENPNVDYMRSFKRRIDNLDFDCQPSWKPSEKQMDALLWCTAHLGGADHRVLAELYEHLKMYCL